MIKGATIAAGIALAICAPPVWAGQKSGPAAAPVPAPIVRMQHISVVTVGDGPAVVLIPGLASPRAVWDGVVANLAKTHRVHLVQVNGFADDPLADASANIKSGMLDGIVADLDRYIATNAVTKPAIVGHSMGGLIAMMMAVRHPASTGRVLVVDALPFFGLLFGPTMTVDALRPQAEQARAATRAAPRATTPVTTDPGGIWSNTPQGRIQIANWSAQADPAVTAQALYEVMTTDLRPELAGATVPITVLYATGAGPQAKTIWESAYAGTPAKLMPIADSWHFIMLDQPAAFQNVIDAFLAAP